MEEKKEIKVRLSTAISMVIIFALIVALGVTYYFGFVADKKEIVGDEKVTNTTGNVATENKTDKKDVVTNDIEKDIKLNIGTFSLIDDIDNEDMLNRIDILEDNYFNIPRTWRRARICWNL